MHDVIAHGVSVMIVQADGAAYVAEQSPADARRALEQIAATGRESLAQMRQLLGLLRTEDATAGRLAQTQPVSAALPQPGLGQLADLVAEAERAGARIHPTVEGDLADLPAMTSLTAYRVVQEGLTNARRHGGPEVELVVARRPDGLFLRVADGGPARPATGPAGFGLIGMRERVDAVGGTLSAGSDPDAGGFVLRAWLPVPADPQEAR